MAAGAAITAALASLTMAAQPAQARSPAGGDQLWASVGDPGAGSVTAVSPNGRTVFVSGTKGTPGEGQDYFTVAYSASTGKPRWTATFSGDHDANFVSAIAVSPDGRRLYVTGRSNFGADFATVAYNAATGRQLWLARYIPAHGVAEGDAIAVAPDGNTVYISGTTNRGIASGESGCETVAYQAATGKQVWTRRYHPASAHFDRCEFLAEITDILLRSNGTQPQQTMAVSPDSGTVYLSAVTYFKPTGGRQEYPNYTVIALNAHTGTVRWSRTYNGDAVGPDTPVAVAVSPDGRSVFVTGGSRRPASGFDYATVAYSASTGARKWVARYNGPSNRQDIATSMTFGNGGRLVIVTGASKAKDTGEDYATVAYAAATGHRAWVSRYTGPVAGGVDVPIDIVPGHGGKVLYVTGTSFVARLRPNFATISYDAATGRQRWLSLYASPSHQARALMVAVSPDGSKVFVTGRGGSDPAHLSEYVFATVAYQG